MKNIPAFLSLVFVAASGLPAVAQLVNTTPSWDGVTAVSPFGESGLATVGQTFSVASGYTQLDAVGFTLSYQAGGPVNYVAAIMAWDSIGLHATGPVLFASGPLSLAPSSSTFMPVIIPTGGLLLSPSNQYVAFLTSSGLFDGTPDIGQVGFVGSDVYAGGGAVALNNGSNIPALGSGPWLSTPADLAFAAVFSSAVPEPSTYGLTGAVALTALIWLRRRRQRA